MRDSYYHPTARKNERHLPEGTIEFLDWLLRLYTPVTIAKETGISRHTTDYWFRSPNNLPQYRTLAKLVSRFGAEYERDTGLIAPAANAPKRAGEFAGSYLSN